MGNSSSIGNNLSTRRTSLVKNNAESRYHEYNFKRSTKHIHYTVYTVHGTL